MLAVTLFIKRPGIRVQDWEPFETPSTSTKPRPYSLILDIWKLAIGFDVPSILSLSALWGTIYKRISSASSSPSFAAFYFWTFDGKYSQLSNKLPVSWFLVRSLASRFWITRKAPIVPPSQHTQQKWRSVWSRHQPLIFKICYLRTVWRALNWWRSACSRLRTMTGKDRICVPWSPYLHRRGCWSELSYWTMSGGLAMCGGRYMGFP